MRSIALLLLAASLVCAQDRSQARSMVISDYGIVATSQTLASQAGAQVLARGGSAVDAAIAANAVLGVVEPESCGIGGDLFAIYWDATTGKLTAINASGWAPKALNIEFLKGLGHTQKMPKESIQAVTVPGCVDGWSKLHKRFGKLPWKDLFAPAIYYAEHGFPVTEIISAAWADEKEALNRLVADRNGKAVFTRNGKAPLVGEVFRNPQLAGALKLLGAEGAPAFYRGAIARALLKTSDRLGGKMALADLSEFESDCRPTARASRRSRCSIFCPSFRSRPTSRAASWSSIRRSKRKSWRTPTCTAMWRTCVSAKYRWTA